MIKLELLVGLVTFALWVFCLVEVIGTDDSRTRHLPKVGWLLLVLLFPLVGSIAWLAVGRPEGGRSGGTRPGRPAAFPEYERPGRLEPADPVADEAFLRQVRARAEEQRRRYEAQRREAQRQEEVDRDRRRQARAEGPDDEGAA